MGSEITTYCQSNPGCNGKDRVLWPQGERAQELRQLLLQPRAPPQPSPPPAQPPAGAATLSPPATGAVTPFRKRARGPGPPATAAAEGDMSGGGFLSQELLPPASGGGFLSQEVLPPAEQA